MLPAFCATHIPAVTTSDVRSLWASVVDIAKQQVDLQTAAQSASKAISAMQSLQAHLELQSSGDSPSFTLEGAEPLIKACHGATAILSALEESDSSQHTQQAQQMQESRDKLIDFVDGAFTSKCCGLEEGELLESLWPEGGGLSMAGNSLVSTEAIIPVIIAGQVLCQVFVFCFLPATVHPPTLEVPLTL